MKLYLSRYGLMTVFLLIAVVLTAQNSTCLLNQWKVEDDSRTFKATQYADTLDLIAPGGLTLWYSQRLSGDYEIRYQICMVMKDGKHDRLSDMNCFWAANDPKYPNDFFTRSDWRGGTFQNYNSLNLFYVGYGGNENTTTRFRRYSGEFYGVDDAKVKPLLYEYTDTANLLFANHWYSIHIYVKGGVTTFSVDGKELFRHSLSPRQGDGYFGLRLLQNHALFTGFQVMKF